MDDFLVQLFDELNNNKINYVVLREYEKLPYKINHDIDFGVLEKDFEKMLKIIDKISNYYHYKKVFESSRQGFYQLYLYSMNNGYCIKLDFWTKFTYKGLEYITIDEIFTHIKKYNNIFVLEENVELLLSFLKEFLHNGRIRKDKYEILKTKLNSAGFFNNQYVDEEDLEFFSDYINNKKFNLKNESKKFIVKLLYKNIKYKGYLKSFQSIFEYFYKFLKDKLLKKSFFLVFIGPDGSGKTTLSKALIDEIKEKKSCFNDYLYIHGRFGILPNLSSLIGNKENTKIMKFEHVEKINKIKKYSRLRIVIYMSYYFFDYFFGYFIIFFKKYKRTLIIADRYYYDYFYQNTFRNYPKIFKFVYKLLPKPDLLIYLKAEPQHIYNRKPELGKDLLIEQQKSIEKMLKYNYLYKKYVIINTNLELQQTIKEIKKVIFE